MASKGSEVKVDLHGLDYFKNLLELLTMYMDELPKELQEQLKIGAENGFGDFSADDFLNMFPNHDFSKVECSHESVISSNKVLKRVKVYDKDVNGFKIIHPEHFYLKYRGETIIGW